MSQPMMRPAILSLLGAVLLGVLAPVHATAQDVEPAPAPPAVDRLVNLDRVKNKLAALPTGDERRSILDLSFYLEVYGRAPRLNVLEGFNITAGRVPFGGPSHADMQELWTPEEFSSPTADLASLFKWLFRR